METKLARISQMSRENPTMIFTSIGHLINKEMLRSCHEAMDGDKAKGIDGVSKAEYEEHLDENLDRLVDRLKRKAYYPQPARRVEIPKDNGKTRPLSIYCYEDKLVQEALKRILEAVFEPMFYDEMMGFRPNRNCHMALRKLNFMLEKEFTGYVLDADIKGFFDHLDHGWIIRFVESRIKDPNIIRLIRVMLKAGIMKDYVFEETEEGSGQGSVCSPILANIYMHYVLVWWFKEKVQPKARGFCGLVVYADDFVVCFQYKDEAELFYKKLGDRMEHFGLNLEKEKSRLIKFGKYAERDMKNWKNRKPDTFTFLGFTHYCSHGRNGQFRVKRKTSKKKFNKKVKEMDMEIREKLIVQGLPTLEVIKWLNQVLVGYYHYYGITDNSVMLGNFKHKVEALLFKWLNRRSQKRSYRWANLYDLLNDFPLARPKIYVSIYGY
ncbi:MAG: group II intron reverse transcriptase/maturase [Spirochaetales bacterium]|nr:group II intron reverse transcriptase/maturase [Spirochaetales bacterium]